MSQYIPIALCAFCGDDATQKASDNTPVCENCAQMYKPEPKRRTPNPQAHKEQ